MIGGYVCVRNGDVLDYCWREAVASLLPVCDEVIICDSDSTDGTTAIACEWASREPKIRVANWPWPNPERTLHWWTDWLNFGRMLIRHPVQITLDADEVLDPSSHDEVLRIARLGAAAWCTRLNYWRDAQHIAPVGTVCAERVARIGPTQYWMTSDGPDFGVHPNIRDHAIFPTSPILIHHYGFLRRTDAFLRKSEVVQRAFFGETDERIRKNQKDLGDWKRGDYFDGKPLIRAIHPHPKSMTKWLRSRGYEIEETK